MNRTWKADVLIGRPVDLEKALNTYEVEGWKVFSVMPYVEPHLTHLGAWTVVVEREEKPATPGLLTGEINVGDKLVWLGDSRTQYERVTVLYISTSLHWSERRIGTTTPTGGATWNGERRIRECCVRDRE